MRPLCVAANDPSLACHSVPAVFSSAFAAAALGLPNLSWQSYSALTVVYDPVPVEGLGAADAIGSIVKGISNVTDCGILQICSLHS
jgi:hypothetical protein